MSHVFFSEQDRQVLLRLLGVLAVQYIDVVNAYEAEKNACFRCIIDCEDCPRDTGCSGRIDFLSAKVDEADARLVALSHALSELSGYEVVFSDTLDYVRSL